MNKDKDLGLEFHSEDYVMWDDERKAVKNALKAATKTVAIYKRYLQVCERELEIAAENEKKLK